MLTSVEKIFHFELLFVKICGGLPFEWPNLPGAHRQWLALTYQFAIVGLTRYWTPTYFMTSPSLVSESISQVAMQNFKLFYYTCQAIGYLMVFRNINMSSKRQRLILALLKKGFNERYLTQASPPPPPSIDPEEIINQVTRSPTTTNTRMIPWNVMPRLFGGNRRHEVSRGDDTISFKVAHFVSPYFLRVSIVKYLLAINLLVAIYSVLVHGKLYASARTLANDNKYDSTFVEPPNVNTSSPMGPPRGEAEEVPGAILSKLTSLFFDSGKIALAFIQASLNLSQLYGQILVALLTTSSIADMLRYSVPFDEIPSGYLVDNKRTTLDLAVDSCPSTLLVGGSSSRIQTKLRFDNNTPSMGSSCSTSGIGSGKSIRRALAHNEYLLTTRVMIQTREVLLVLRHTVSIEYLLVLLYDLARMGAVVCLLDESIFNSDSNQKTLRLIVANFALVLMSVILTRIGHRWLHSEVEKLIHKLEKNTVLTDLSQGKFDPILRDPSRSSKWSSRHLAQSTAASEIESANSIDLQKSNRMTSLRLAKEISNIWPTDWYTPDYKSCIEQAIYVVTFVATFHQLAEASSRLNYSASLMSELK